MGTDIEPDYISLTQNTHTHTLNSKSSLVFCLDQLMQKLFQEHSKSIFGLLVKYIVHHGLSEMAAMPFPCNGHLLCDVKFAYSFVNVFQ